MQRSNSQKTQVFWDRGQREQAGEHRPAEFSGWWSLLCLCSRCLTGSSLAFCSWELVFEGASLMLGATLPLCQFFVMFRQCQNEQFEIQDDSEGNPSDSQDFLWRTGGAVLGSSLGWNVTVLPWATCHRQPGKQAQCSCGWLLCPAWRLSGSHSCFSLASRGFVGAGCRAKLIPRGLCPVTA